MVLALIWAAVASCLLACMVQDMAPVPFALGALATGLACLVATRAWVTAELASRGLLLTDGQDDAIDDLGAFLRRPGLVCSFLPAAATRASARMADAVEALLASRWSPRRHRSAFPLVTAIVFGACVSGWHALIEGPGGPLGGFVIGTRYAIAGASIVLVAYATLGRYLRLVGPDRSP